MNFILSSKFPASCIQVPITRGRSPSSSPASLRSEIFATNLPPPTCLQLTSNLSPTLPRISRKFPPSLFWAVSCNQLLDSEIHICTSPIPGENKSTTPSPPVTSPHSISINQILFFNICKQNSGPSTRLFFATNCY